MNPRYPIYIPSKGRWESRRTMRALDAMGVPYRVVVEESERSRYASVIDERKLLILDGEYQRCYDTCDELGDSMGRGSGPARNFIWDHAIAGGHTWHWVMDDNIFEFYILYKNLKVPVSDGSIFRAMEDFCSRYVNIALAGPNYAMFVYRKKPEPPIIMNTRIFSCILVRCDIPYRWRGRFNEDADLSIRALKDKWCTVQFNAFLQNKAATQSMMGGNTDTIYKQGTLLKSVMLYRLHPDVTKLKWLFGRPHHRVNYRVHFKNNKLVRKSGIKIGDGSKEYGMKLKYFDTDRSRIEPLERSSPDRSTNARLPTDAGRLR